MSYTLFDSTYRNHLLPITFTRPVSEIRIGILTIREKWERMLDAEINSWLTEDYLAVKYPINNSSNNIYINGHVCPDKDIVSKVFDLKEEQGIKWQDEVIAIKTSNSNLPASSDSNINWIELSDKPCILEQPWQIFTLNGDQLKADFQLITQNRKSKAISETNNILGAENIFIEEGAKLNFATINATKGSVYIGRNAEIMEGSLIRGPFALCDHATVNMGAKIYGPTTIGPYSKVGGEINNSVIQGYSNKGHDGFLGNSVIGEWCNLGADTNTSNLKNDYTEVKLWNYTTNRFAKTGLQFCGLIMGDHSKCGINTMFNSGTVIGVGSNIFGTGYPRNFVPSFSAGGSHGFTTHALNKMIKTAETAMQRRNIELSDTDKNILADIFENTSAYRKY